jgi:hypothetical protein
MQASWTVPGCGSLASTIPPDLADVARAVLLEAAALTTSASVTPSGWTV